MQRLTPELWLHSAVFVNSDGTTTRNLDFNLARRSAVVINRIVSQMFLHVDVLSGNETAGIGIQEVDVDPDNDTVEFAGVTRANAVVIDSSRVLRHVFDTDRDTATGGGSQGHNAQLIKDWHGVPLAERPISITNLVQNVVANADLSNVLVAEINIDYFIVELDLREIGILNSSRR